MKRNLTYSVVYFSYHEFTELMDNDLPLIAGRVHGGRRRSLRKDTHTVSALREKFLKFYLWDVNLIHGELCIRRVNFQVLLSLHT